MHPRSRAALALCGTIANVALAVWAAGCSKDEGTQDRVLGGDSGVDAVAALDAGPDGPDALADAAPGCLGTSHTFCEDFDTLPLGTSWDDTVSSPKETLTIVATKSFSPARSLQISLPTAGGGKEGRLTKTIALAGGTTALKAGFDWSITNAGVPDMVLLTIGVHSALTGESSALTLSAGDLYSISETKQPPDAGVQKNDLIGTTVARNSTAWTRIDLELAGGDPDAGGASRITLTVGGNKVLAGATLAITVPPPYDAATLVLGPSRIDTTTAWLVNVDNLTFDATSH